MIVNPGLGFSYSQPLITVKYQDKIKKKTKDGIVLEDWEEFNILKEDVSKQT